MNTKAAQLTENGTGIVRLFARFALGASFLSAVADLAMGMATGLGTKTPFDYSVFSAAAAAFLLAFWEPDRFTLDKLLSRSRSRTGITSIPRTLRGIDTANLRSESSTSRRAVCHP